MKPCKYCGKQFSTVRGGITRHENKCDFKGSTKTKAKPKKEKMVHLTELEPGMIARINGALVEITEAPKVAQEVDSKLKGVYLDVFFKQNGVERSVRRELQSKVLVS